MINFSGNAGSQQPNPGGPIHILLAEDNLLLQQAIKIMLTHRGFAVTAVRNGKQAVEQIQQKPVHLLLMAINMPVMDGVEATLAIRQFNKYTPIIAFTSYEEATFLLHIKKAGMNGFLSKYASPDLICETIMRHVAVEQPGQQQ